MPRWFEKEEDRLTEALNRGEISDQEFSEAMRDLQRELRESAEEAARDAYDREMDR